LTEDHQLIMRGLHRPRRAQQQFSWPVRLVLRHADARITALCCARAASGHAKAEPATALPSPRDRITPTMTREECRNRSELILSHLDAITGDIFYEVAQD
jgi:hypothetical protein